MATGFNTGFQPYIQPQMQPQMQPGYSQYAGQPVTAQPSYAQNPAPAQYQSYQTQQYPQAPGIVNYVMPPTQYMPQGQNPQSGLNSAAQNAYQTQTQYATQGQPQALSHIPYEQNPLNMDSGFNPAGNPQNLANSGMNAQMPAPDMQGGQGTAMNAQGPVKQPFLDVGVVNAPENFSKTPIIDDLNRRGQSTERETPPKLRGKKTFTLGNVSAALSMGSLGIILTMALCKALKLIKHK